MANREEGAAVPNQRQGQNKQQEQQQNQDAAGQDSGDTQQGANVLHLITEVKQS